MINLLKNIGKKSMKMKLTWRQTWNQYVKTTTMMQKITTVKYFMIYPCKNQYPSILFPKGIVFPASVSDLVEQAKSKSVKIIFADDYNETPSPEKLLELIGCEDKIMPACSTIAFGKFTREGREVYLMVNTGGDSYNGVLEVLSGKRYIELDPQTGEIARSQNLLGNIITLNLAPLQTKIFTVI